MFLSTTNFISTFQKYLEIRMKRGSLDHFFTSSCEDRIVYWSLCDVMAEYSNQNVLKIETKPKPKCFKTKTETNTRFLPISQLKTNFGFKHVRKQDLKAHLCDPPHELNITRAYHNTM